MRHSAAFSLWVERVEALATQPRLPASQTGLRRASILLEQIGNPHREFRAVHVTGSNGKGSTSAMVACILRAASFRTGSLRSPHLVSYTERITVDGEEIQEQDWCRYFERIWPVVVAMSDGTLPGYQLGRPSFSEVLFAVASLHFLEAGVEWAALEAGMGGRLDATNLVNSDVAIITNVSLEHTQILGTTVAKIAAEKAAIIKRGSTAVTASRDPDALAVIARRAVSQGATLLRVPPDVVAEVRDQNTSGARWALIAGDHAYETNLRVLGGFQGTNAATAVAATLALRARGVSIADKAIIRGLEDTRVPGRLEVMAHQPAVILDGAHNPDASRHLVQALDDLLPGERIVLLFGALVDKDIDSMAASLSRRAEVAYVTRAPGTPRASDPRDLARHFERYGCRAVAKDDVGVALSRALEEIRSGGTLLVCGSLYLVGHVREIMEAMKVKL